MKLSERIHNHPTSAPLTYADKDLWKCLAFQLEAENEELKDVMRDVRSSGVSFEDPRLDYREVQLDVDLWARIDALLIDKPFVGGTVSTYFDTERDECSDKITYDDIVAAVKILEENRAPGPYTRIMHPNEWAREIKEWEDETAVVRDSDPSM